MCKTFNLTTYSWHLLPICNKYFLIVTVGGCLPNSYIGNTMPRANAEKVGPLRYNQAIGALPSSSPIAFGYGIYHSTGKQTRTVFRIKSSKCRQRWRLGRNEEANGRQYPWIQCAWVGRCSRAWNYNIFEFYSFLQSLWWLWILKISKPPALAVSRARILLPYRKIR